MKTAYLFHSNRCCITDCLVRSCTCGVKPVAGQDATNASAALDFASECVGGELDGGIWVDRLSETVDEKDGVLTLHFITSPVDEAEDDVEESI